MKQTGVGNKPVVATLTVTDGIDEGVITYGEAARHLGVHRATIRDLVRAHGIEPKRVALNGNAKGLDARDLSVLARALNRSRP